MDIYTDAEGLTERQERVKKKMRAMPEYKVLVEMGWEPYDTESSARAVSEYASRRIWQLEEDLKRLKKLHEAEIKSIHELYSFPQGY